jgi:hypothetical protein
MRRAERRDFALAYAAWLLGIFAFFIPAATWNPVSRFNLTRAIVEQGSLKVDAYVHSTGDRSRVGDHWYSDKAPVVAVLAVPAYAGVYVSQRLRGATLPDFRAISTPKVPAARVIPNRAYQQALYACSLSTSGLGAIAIALMLFVFLKRRTSSRAAFLGSSLAVLASPILPYATSLYGHVPAAAFIFGGVFALDHRGGLPPPSPARWRIAGACFALAAGCEYLTAVSIIVLMAWLLMRVPGRGRLHHALDLVLGGLLPSILVMVYLTLVFGAPWRTGYSFESQPEFVAGHASGFMGLHPPRLEGLLGLTFGVRRGLFYMAPLMLVAVIRTFRAAQRRRDLSVQVGLSVLITLLLLNAGYYMWWGGAATGPRHLIPGIAFLGVGIASAFRSRHRWLPPLTAVLAVLSVVSFTAATLVGIEAPEHGDILRQWIWRRVSEAKFSLPGGGSNLGMKLGLSPALSVLPLLVWMIAGYSYLLRQTRRQPGRPA